MDLGVFPVDFWLKGNVMELHVHIGISKWFTILRIQQ